MAETLDEEAQEDFEPEYVPQAWQTYRNEDGSFKYLTSRCTNSIYPWGSIVEEDGVWQQIAYKDRMLPRCTTQ